MVDRNSISSIAVFRALQLGDMLCIIPTIRAIRSGFPEAEITLISLPWQRGLRTRFGNYFDHFIDFPGWPGLPETSWEAETSTSFLTTMQKHHFDLVLQMQGNGILTNSMCLLWSGKYTVGLRKSSEEITRGIYTVSEDSDHEILRFLKLVDALEIDRKGTDLEFPISQDELHEFTNACGALGIEPKKYVCIHPGARDPKRRWGKENFARVAEALYHRGFAVLVTGSASESEIINELQSHCRVPLINSVKELGDYGIGVLAALVDNCALLVCNDTGVSHIAAARKVPSVIIFSPYSDQKRWAPLNKELHIAIPAEEALHVHRVISVTLDHLRQQRQEKSHLFLDQK